MDFSPRSRWVSAARKYIAIRDDNQCRIRLVYVRTSNAPKPASCLARPNHFSTCQRAKATGNMSNSGVFAEALLTKYLISSVWGLWATINQYCRSVGCDTGPDVSTGYTRAAFTPHATSPRVVFLIVIRRHFFRVNTGL